MEMENKDPDHQGTSYFELDGPLDSILKFSGPDSGALAQLREIVAGLPIRTYNPSSQPIDAWEEAAAVGGLEEIVKRLTQDLKKDREANDELGTSIIAELLFTESHLHRDALHVITRLRPRARGGESISYGARIQRTEENVWVLWSDY